MASSLSANELKTLYTHRFSAAERREKDKIWQVLCAHYFQQFIRPEHTVLDLACGQGEFIRHIRAAHKIAVDLNPEVAPTLPPDIRFVCADATALHDIETGTVDVCFVSNFFEHLPSKQHMDQVLQELRRVLKPGGRLVAMQPNIRVEPGRYWDFYDHLLPLSDRSAAEAFAKNGLTVEKVVPRFVPFTTKSALPRHPWLIRAYLALPFIWPLFGGQFVIVGRAAKEGA